VVAQNRSGEGGDGLLVLLVRRSPRGVALAFADRLEQVGLQAVLGERAVVPRAEERLPEEVLGTPVEQRTPVILRQPPPLPDRLGPGGGLFRQHTEPGPHVLGPLGVVSGQRGHRLRPVLVQPGSEGVELLRRHTEVLRIPTDLVQRREPEPPVERGVLDPLGHHRPTGLLEPHDQLVPRVLVDPARGPGLPAQQQLQYDVQGLLPVLIEVRARLVGGPLQRVDRRRRRLLPRRHVGPVDVEVHQQFDDDLVERTPCVIAQPDVVLTDAGQQLHEAMHFGVLPVLDDLPLRLFHHRCEVGRRAGQLGVQRRERCGAGGVDEEAADPQECVVSGGAGAGPVAGKLFVAFEDLLDHDPRTTGALGQTPQVAPRVGQPVRMVDAEAVELALVQELEQQLVRGLEDLLRLHAHRGEGVDVEEAPVVQLLVGDPPMREAVPLLGHQLRDRQVLGARPERVLVLVVPQYVAVDRQLAVREHLPDPLTQHRHQQRLIPRPPVHVEPLGVRRTRPVPQHRPERLVEPRRRRHGDMVRYDVRHGPHAVIGQPRREPVERRAAAGRLGQATVVDHVVPVGGAGRGLEDRGQVGVGDPEAVQVRDDRGGVVETELGAHLQPIGGLRDRCHPAARRGRVRTSMPWGSIRMVLPAMCSPPSARPVGLMVSTTTDHASPYSLAGSRKSCDS
jgi:hypothetical protein